MLGLKRYKDIVKKKAKYLIMFEVSDFSRKKKIYRYTDLYGQAQARKEEGHTEPTAYVIPLL